MMMMPLLQTMPALSLLRHGAFLAVLLLLLDGTGVCQGFVVVLGQTRSGHHNKSPTHTKRPTTLAVGTGHSESPGTSAAFGTDVSITLPSFSIQPEQGTNDDSSSSSYPSPLHHIYIQSILTDEQAAQALRMAREHASTTGQWSQPDTERHATYATCDFPVEDCPALQDFLDDECQVTEQIWQLLTTYYGGGGGSSSSGLEYDDLTYLDFFVAHYEAATTTTTSMESTTTMDRLEAHRDGSLLSFTITLSPPEDFDGGGTFFEALKQNDNENGVVRPDRAGDVVLHCGKLLHGADVVTRGSRTVLVGFVDVAEWRQRPGVLGQACREWGRMDVAQRRHDRQVEQLQSKESRWPEVHPKSSKWLPRHTKSHLQLPFVPAFASVQRRADPTFQRLRRMQAEDDFLRNILLPAGEDAKGEWIPFDSEDVTIL